MTDPQHVSDFPTPSHEIIAFWQRWIALVSLFKARVVHLDVVRIYAKQCGISPVARRFGADRGRLRPENRAVLLCITKIGRIAQDSCLFFWSAGVKVFDSFFCIAVTGSEVDALIGQTKMNWRFQQSEVELALPIANFSIVSTVDSPPLASATQKYALEENIRIFIIWERSEAGDVSHQLGNVRLGPTDDEKGVGENEYHGRNAQRSDDVKDGALGASNSMANKRNSANVEFFISRCES